MDQLPGYVRELCQVIPHDEQDTTFIELEFKVCVGLELECGIRVGG